MFKERTSIFWDENSEKPVKMYEPGRYWRLFVAFKSTFAAVFSMHNDVKKFNFDENLVTYFNAKRY